MTQRKIVRIDEEKCDGCGECVLSCAEGAIAIRDGKAKLVSDVYCDGLGACIGHCPREAITIIEREAAPFVTPPGHGPVTAAPTSGQPAADGSADVGKACLAAEPKSAGQRPAKTGSPCLGLMNLNAGAGGAPLQNWPIQLRLVSPHAPYLQHADLLLVADCVPFALADFHRRLTHGQPLLIGCPKLDDAAAYVEKLAEMLVASAINSVTVVHMQVPCCTGLLRIVEAAKQRSGANVRIESITISTQGEIVAGRTPPGTLTTLA